ncbi:hypothetical protein COHA_001602 [Chlorella ohadii]|uniref:Arrestin C-terminal-like domain-containing protein n=1 Tax=Chlorella ohadii TaxID=2649997 RepID=A0AAD5H8S2_9CHLO|nr:hypothetical protein COHA_001602 [Chlorella ohadii]
MDVRKSCVTILMDRRAYAPGEVVDGLVCLNLLQTVESRGLFIKLKGYEECMYKEPYTEVVIRNGHAYKETKYHTRTGRLQYFDHSVCVAGPGIYQPGQYQVPFVVPLPADLLPSFDFKETGLMRPEAKRSSACVHYKLKATLYNKGAFKSNLDGYAYLNVVRDEQGQRRMQHQTTDIVTCGCFGKSPAAAKAILASDVVTNNGKVCIDLDVENGSSHPFKSIQVRLMRRMAFVNDANTAAFAVKYIEPAVTQSFPGFTKQEPQGKRLLELVVPPTLPPSVAADVVECKYWLEVHCRTMLASNLVLHLPLTIIRATSAQTHHEPVLLKIAGAPEVDPASFKGSNHFWTECVDKWASAPLVPGSLPPPPAVGYDVSDEEGEALEAKMSLTGSGFDVNDMGKKPRKAATPPVVNINFQSGASTPAPSTPVTVQAW